ncbi:uncharacterized protein LOC118600082 [Oryzias melastigma]|uniref:uncharacterized protein LOC118600082 n=1 Tax=Oryzias melastigma TaxID=30732 RepID=UPI00168CED2C|nr:uncharacterized protein LOC118600082 [Oryzias melastigma]
MSSRRSDLERTRPPEDPVVQSIPSSRGSRPPEDPVVQRILSTSRSRPPEDPVLQRTSSSRGPHRPEGPTSRGPVLQRTPVVQTIPSSRGSVLKRTPSCSRPCPPAGQEDTQPAPELLNVGWGGQTHGPNLRENSSFWRGGLSPWRLGMLSILRAGGVGCCSVLFPCLLKANINTKEVHQNHNSLCGSDSGPNPPQLGAQKHSPGVVGGSRAGSGRNEGPHGRGSERSFRIRAQVLTIHHILTDHI